MMNEKKYPAKILVFGEYTVLQGSQAIAAPLLRFSGKWSGYDCTRQYDLPQFCAYLAAQNLPLDTARMSQMLAEGLFFDSDVPRGYGAGSSGALVAAIYDVFATEKTDDIAEIKSILGRIEGYFHGTSSGIDPLVSYVQKTVLVAQNQQNTLIELPKLAKTQFFLLDTKIPRKTEPLVRIFAEKMATPQYADKIKSKFVPTVDTAIAALRAANDDELWAAVRDISHLQHDLFEEMIPLPFKNIWEKGIKSDFFKLKLCGAGGGGFILGFTQNATEAQKILSENGFKPIFINI